MKENLIEVAEDHILLGKPLIDVIINNHGTLEKHIFSLGDDLYMFGHMTTEDKAFYFKTANQIKHKLKTEIKMIKKAELKMEDQKVLPDGHIDYSNYINDVIRELKEKIAAGGTRDQIGAWKSELAYMEA